MFRQKTKVQKQAESLQSMLEFSDMLSKRKLLKKFLKIIDNDEILNRLLSKRDDIANDLDRRKNQLKEEYKKFYNVISL
jgi:hypothetical protein